MGILIWGAIENFSSKTIRRGLRGSHVVLQWFVVTLPLRKVVLGFYRGLAVFPIQPDLLAERSDHKQSTASPSRRHVVTAWHTGVPEAWLLTPSTSSGLHLIFPPMSRRARRMYPTTWTQAEIVCQSPVPATSGSPSVFMRLDSGFNWI